MLTKVNGVLVWGYATDDEVFNFLNTYQLTRPPGAKWEYSNLANGILGVAEERVGQSNYDSLVTNQVTGPLSMPDMRITLSAAEKANLAQGYQMNGQPAPAIAVSGAALGAGALHSSIRDLPTYLLDNIDLGGTKLASTLEMTELRQSIGSPPKFAIGLGWLIYHAGTPAEQFAKDGATAGFISYIAFSKDTRSGFVMVCNGHNVSKSLAPQINKLLGPSETESDDSS